MPDLVTASAPGSLMLFGEHAVLHGHAAVVAAVNQRMRVRLAPRSDDVIAIDSALGRASTTLGALNAGAAFRFVTAAIRARRESLASGFDLAIESDFSPTVGLGSSAAVTVATLAALRAWTGRDEGAEALCREGRDVIRAVQGMGSGADVAASVHGGVLAYRAEPFAVERLGGLPPVTVVYSGSKLPTPEVVARVERLRELHGRPVAAIFEAMGEVSQEAAAAVRSEDWEALGGLMGIGQGLMAALGLSNETLEAIIRALCGDGGVHGAKICGSGLGDCVVGIGKVESLDCFCPLLTVALGDSGVEVS